MRGHVIGLLTMASEKGTIGFAVPINVVKNMIPRLLSAERISWGWLGVRLKELTLSLAENLGLSPLRGVLVNFVSPGQAADRAGILSNDIILAVNETRVDRVSEVKRIIRGTEAGSEAKLTIFRKGEIFDIRVKLGRKPHLTGLRDREGFLTVPQIPRGSMLVGTHFERVDMSWDTGGSCAGINSGDFSPDSSSA